MPLISSHGRNDFMTRKTLELNRAIEYMDSRTNYAFDTETDYQVLSDTAGALFGASHWATQAIEDYANDND